MTAEEFSKKIKYELQQPQFLKMEIKEKQKKRFALFIDEKFNRAMSDLKQNGKINEDFDKAARITGGQPPARLYWLAKVHKKNTLLRLVLSLPGSCYAPLTDLLARWWERLPEAQMETTSNDKKDLDSFDRTQRWRSYDIAGCKISLHKCNCL